MEFKTPAHAACYEKIAPWMQELFESTVVQYNNDTLFVTRFGSAVAYTRVEPWGEDKSIVLTRACLVTHVEVSAELTHYLLRENDNLYFGRFGLDSENNIIFEDSLVGSTCDREELKTSVTAVLQFADEYDDKIVARWGGQRAVDRWSNALPWE